MKTLLATIAAALLLAAPTAAAAPYRPDTVITDSFYGEGAQYVVYFTAADINSPNYPIEFECRVDGGEWLSCGDPAAGLPTYELLSGLEPGKHVFRVRTLFRGAVDNTPATVRFDL